MQEMQPNLERRRWLLFALDQIFAILVIGPLVIGFWRGTWSLLDIYVTPDDPLTSHLVTAGVGNVGLFLLAVLQEPLKAYRPNWWLVAFILPRLYVYVAGVFSVCQWRGLWAGLDIFHGMTTESFVYFGIAGK